LPEPAELLHGSAKKGSVKKWQRQKKCRVVWRGGIRIGVAF